MKFGNPRHSTLIISFVIFAQTYCISCPSTTKSFGDQLVDSLEYLSPLCNNGNRWFYLIIYNSIAIRRKAFIKDDVIQPIMQELQSLNIEGAKALCDQYKLPVTTVLKGGLERIQDDELDIESIEKGLEESSGLELAKPFTWINMLNTIGSIAPMIGLLGTVSGMIGAFNVLAEAGMGGDPVNKWPEILVVRCGQLLLGLL